MFVILTYDISADRNAKMLKTCRKYLMHVQKSVFEGNLTEAKLKKLQKELEQIICMESDKLCIYKLESLRFVSKVKLGAYESHDIFL